MTTRVLIQQRLSCCLCQSINQEWRGTEVGKALYRCDGSRQAYSTRSHSQLLTHALCTQPIGSHLPKVHLCCSSNSRELNPGKGE